MIRTKQTIQPIIHPRIKALAMAAAVIAGKMAEEEAIDLLMDRKIRNRGLGGKYN
jgi:hypothetical protein